MVWPVTFLHLCFHQAALCGRVWTIQPFLPINPVSNRLLRITQQHRLRHKTRACLAQCRRLAWVAYPAATLWHRLKSVLKWLGPRDARCRLWSYLSIPGWTLPNQWPMELRRTKTLVKEVRFSCKKILINGGSCLSFREVLLFREVPVSHCQHVDFFHTLIVDEICTYTHTN